MYLVKKMEAFGIKPNGLRLSLLFFIFFVGYLF